MAGAEREREALTVLIDRLDRAIALFNKKGMDLPEGIFDRTTQFLLNGAPYETLVGQSPAAPLILMLTRGPAGYRFIAKALQHAVPDAAIERGDVAWTDEPSECGVSLWLSGHARGSNEPIHLVFRAVLTLTPAGSIGKADVTLDQAAYQRLRDARYLP